MSSTVVGYVAGAAALGLVVAASARGRSASGRGGSRGPVARMESASTWSAVVGGLQLLVCRVGCRWLKHLREKSLFFGTGDGGARGCRDLPWKRRSGGVLTPLPAALVPVGNLRSSGSGDGGVPASFSSLGASSRSGLRLGDRWLMVAGSSRPGASTSVWQR
jgi:hypothetical protein